MPGKGRIPTPLDNATDLWRIKRDEIATDLIMNEGMSPDKALKIATEKLEGEPLEHED